jgi:hypothetical protein
LTQLGRMNLAVSTQAATAAAWRDLPATYVRCTQDLLPELLAPGFLDRVTQIVELPQPTARSGAGLIWSPICS